MEYQDTTSSTTTSADYKEIPCGYYKCFVNSCERTQSKAGKPMLKVTLKIASACDDANKEFEGRYMWVYQMTTTDYGEQAAKTWESIIQHFPQTPIKVSKYVKRSKAGNEFVNYKPWLTEKQQERIDG